VVVPFQMPKALKCDDDPQPQGKNIATAVPFLADATWQGALAENGANIAIGLAHAACPAQQWVATASWKANHHEKLSEKDCHNLKPMLARHGSELWQGLSHLPLDSAVYWWDNPVHGMFPLKREQRNDFANYLRVVPRQAEALAEFFEAVLGLDMRALVGNAKSSREGMALPLANWFMTTPRVWGLIAKLQALFYSWLETKSPLKVYKCGPAAFSFPPEMDKHVTTSLQKMIPAFPRCWSYFGEALTLLFLTNSVNLYRTDCDSARGNPRLVPFHDRVPAAHFATQIEDAWNLMVAAAPA